MIRDLRSPPLPAPSLGNKADVSGNDHSRDRKSVAARRAPRRGGAGNKRAGFESGLSSAAGTGLCDRRREDSGRRWVVTIRASKRNTTVGCRTASAATLRRNIFGPSDLMRVVARWGAPRIPKSLHPSRVEIKSDPGLTRVTQLPASAGSLPAIWLRPLLKRPA